MEKIKFYLRNRFVIICLFNIVFIGINFLYTGSLVPSTATRDFWFYSGLMLLIFSILFVEPFYSSPKNIITNCLPLLISYIAIKDEFKSSIIWGFTFGLILLCIVLSIISIAIQSDDQSSDSSNNKLADSIRRKIVVIGEGKVIYSIVFLSAIFLYRNDLNSSFGEHYFIAMIILWGLILVIDSKSLHSKFKISTLSIDKDSIGEIFSVQSNNMYLIRIFEDKNDVKKFDLVNFKYSNDDHSHKINQGIVFDTYKLNTQRWAKVMCLNTINDSGILLSKNIIYRINPESLEGLTTQLKIERFVGVVIEGSKIGVIRFEYSKKDDNLQEGNLLELTSQGKKILYQVIGGITEFERLENKNESGFITGEAIQLGIWDNENLSFEKFGWIPEINTPLFLAKTDDIEIKEFALPEFQLGVIPNTNLPSVINLDIAVSHHIALLGVTGSGKSFLALELIKKLIGDTNVICVDFTGEYKKDLVDLAPVDLIKVEGLAALETTFAEKHQKALSKQPKDELELRQKIQEQLSGYVSTFIEGEPNLGLFELPALSNTLFILEFTQYFFESVFNYAKANEGKKICLVLEEAHTIVPETGFLGDLGDYGSTKALVNKMSQIALQGRKYGVGLMIIAQRTANVSKTVLTQCNTIICFQAFDETSFTFLGNYIGKDLVQTLPNLKKYQAVVTGKAIKSNIPMIVDLERK